MFEREIVTRAIKKCCRDFAVCGNSIMSMLTSYSLRSLLFLLLILVTGCTRTDSANEKETGTEKVEPKNTERKDSNPKAESVESPKKESVSLEELRLVLVKLQKEQVRPELKRSSDQANYVGPAACAECHSERHDEFSLTNHYSTCRPANVNSLKSRIEKAGVEMKTRNPVVSFSIKEKDGKVFQEGIAGAMVTNSKPIEMEVGAGEVDEDYFYWEGDKLFQLPVVYLKQLECWGNSPGFMDGTADFNRPVPARCLECHATFIEEVKGTVNQFKPDSLIFGVTCERCHGPASEHVKFHRENTSETLGKFIANPEHLTREAQIEICGQCHGNGTKRYTPPFSFRPGDSVASHFRIDANNNPEEEHTSNQVRYMMESKCFLESDAMTCTTCHSPHVKQEEQRKVSMAACAKCHEPAACKPNESFPEAVRGNCVDCHMPKRRVNNITFDLASDEYKPLIERYEHKVDVYMDARDEVLLKYFEKEAKDDDRSRIEELRKSLVEHYLKEAATRDEEKRLLASAGALRKAIEFGGGEEVALRLKETLQRKRKVDLEMQSGVDAHSAGKPLEAISHFRTALEVSPNLAIAHGKLGAALLDVAKPEEGLAELMKVGELDPDSSYGYALLGYYFLVGKEFEKAELCYRIADIVEPSNAKIQYYLGQVLIKREKKSEAISQWKRALEFDPMHGDSAFALMIALANDGARAEAIKYGRIAALAKDNSEPKLKVTLAELLVSEKQFDEAVAWLEKYEAQVPVTDVQIRLELKNLIQAINRMKKR